MSAGGSGRVDAAPGFVLHAYPFRETSLVVEVVTRDHGRAGLVAKGARRPRSALRGMLLPFQPLLLSWSGKSELRTLVRAEWQGGLPLLRGRSLICGFYLNELLVRLLPRGDPHEALFGHYAATLRALAGGADPSPALRRFETLLLRELGYAVGLERDADSGEPVDPGTLYTYVLERGPVAAEPGSGGGGAPQVLGHTLLDMARDCYDDAVTLQQSKNLMRFLIAHYLGDQPLHTRQLMKDLQSL